MLVGGGAARANTGRTCSFRVSVDDLRPSNGDLEGGGGVRLVSIN